MARTGRMSAYQRREQLIEVGRSLFATKGFEAVSVEEIASHAKVSKPIVYEHFGGKEGLYAVVVDREMRAMTETLLTALSDQNAHPRQIVERTALALLTYIEENSEGFQVLVRDSPMADNSSSFSSLWGDISLRVEDILTVWFKKQKLPLKGVAYYAQMLVGMTVFTGQYWANNRKMSKEQLAALIVNLGWHGLSRLEAHPALVFETGETVVTENDPSIEIIAELAASPSSSASDDASDTTDDSSDEIIVENDFSTADSTDTADATGSPELSKKELKQAAKEAAREERLAMKAAKKAAKQRNAAAAEEKLESEDE